MTAFDKCIGTLLKIDAFGAHAVSQPMVLIEANARREGKIGTNANEHPTPTLVVNVKVILHDPALSQLQVPAVFCSDGNHDPGGFPGFENRHHLVFLGVLKVWIDKVVTSFGRRIQNGRAPFLATVLDPVLKLLSNITQKIPSNSLALAIGIKEADYPLGLLKRLYQSVQKNPIKTTVGKIDAILMMLAEGVHRLLLCGQIPGTYRGESLCDIERHTKPGRSCRSKPKAKNPRGFGGQSPLIPLINSKENRETGVRLLGGSTGYQGRSPWLVSPGSLSFDCCWHGQYESLLYFAWLSLVFDLP